MRYTSPTSVFRSLSDEAAAEFRNKELGFVWQFHYLLPEFTAVENVAMPLFLRGVARSKAEDEARKWLSEVGLSERGHHRSGELSGGEQQRVSLARALVTRPQVLMADEPTGDLDNRTAEAVFDLIARLHSDYRLTSLIVTHNLAFARRCTAGLGTPCRLPRRGATAVAAGLSPGHEFSPPQGGSLEGLVSQLTGRHIERRLAQGGSAKKSSRSARRP